MRKRLLLSAFRIKTSSCTHQINSHVSRFRSMKSKLLQRNQFVRIRNLCNNVWSRYCFRKDWNHIEFSRETTPSIDSSSLMMTRRFTKIFVVILSETTRCWRCKDDAWSLMWHISQRYCEDNFRCLKINSRKFLSIVYR